MNTAARALPASLLLVTALVARSLSATGPRITAVPDDRRTSEQQLLAARFASAGMPNAVATYLNHPSLAEHILPYEHYVSSESTLPPRHRVLIGLRTAWLTRSNYLWARRSAAARRAGLTNEDLRRIAQGPDVAGWDAFEAALLRAADELHVDSFVSDATWRTLAGRYDTNQLIDVVDSVGDLTMHAGALNSLGVEIEAAFGDRFPTGLPYTIAAKRTNDRLVGKEPRIRPLDPHEWAPELRQRLDPSGSGRPIANVFRTFVRNPAGDQLRNAVTSHIRGATTWSPRHRELLLMRIGVLCRSEYEWAAHSRIGRQTGMGDADVARIVATSAGPASGGDAL